MLWITLLIFEFILFYLSIVAVVALFLIDISHQSIEYQEEPKSKGHLRKRKTVST